MKKLILTASVVAIALIGFIAVLCILPCNSNCCGGKEHRIEKVWTDADGKMHKEVIVTMGDEKEMQGDCPMDKDKCGMSGMENGKCNMMDKGMSGSCPMEQGKCGMGGMENGKCSMDKGMEMGGKCQMHGDMQMGCGMHGDMKMGGCCCCCCMMMMNCHGDSMPKTDSSVHVKIRGKL